MTRLLLLLVVAFMAFGCGSQAETTAADAKATESKDGKASSGGPQLEMNPNYSGSK